MRINLHKIFDWTINSVKEPIFVHFPELDKGPNSKKEKTRLSYVNNKSKGCLTHDDYMLVQVTYKWHGVKKTTFYIYPYDWDRAFNKTNKYHQKVVAQMQKQKK